MHPRALPELKYTHRFLFPMKSSWPNKVQQIISPFSEVWRWGDFFELGSGVPAEIGAWEEKKKKKQERKEAEKTDAAEGSKRVQFL